MVEFFEDVDLIVEEVGDVGLFEGVKVDNLDGDLLLGGDADPLVDGAVGALA